MSGFRFVKDATVWWPVKWLEPVDGGGAQEASIELKLRRLGTAEAEAVLELSNRDLLNRVAVDWRGALDAAGNPVPFEDPWISAWLDIVPVPAAIGEAWLRCLRAQPEIRSGNFEASPGGGPGEAAPTAAATSSKPASGRRSAKRA
ncbi:hypothetical protein [Polymorphobacter sp.]|uniref:hypothetical protein n=1 Tax=Polymorphobacter sp. TaxID=1909290 RepID=UPI003F7157B6